MAIGAIALIFAYLAVTAPMALVMLKVHGLKSDYTGVFMLAMFLQLIPVGLIFFPLGLVGLALLGFTLASTLLRNRKFRRMAIHNPEVHRRWTIEAIANMAALGLALTQKGVALAFAEVVSRKGWQLTLLGLAPAAVLIWVVLGWAITREWRVLRGLAESG